tara:strand:+ start:3683 stop:5146 length:1464 start_codon:yes stop_codon:yes gene_type:complete
MSNSIPPPPPPGGGKDPPKRKEFIPKPRAPSITDVGHIPPQAVDMERVVLGALMVDTRACAEVVKLLDEKVFYHEPHRLIYTAIKSLYDTGLGIDILTVSHELTRRGTLIASGSEYYLIELTQLIGSAAHVEYHARIVLQKFVLRELIIMSRETIHKSLHNDPDIFKLTEGIENTIAYINTVAINPDGIQQALITPEQELTEKLLMQRRGETPGIALGVSEFDDWCGGWQKRELITIGARPGMGKTTIGIAAAVTASISKGHDTAFFSLEMSKIDVMNRVAARLTGIEFSKIKGGKLTDDEFKQVLATYKFIDESKLHIHDTMEHKNFHERIIKKIRELVSSGTKLVFIDYVQLMKLVRATTDRTGDLSKITRELKGLANELNIPIIIFAQLNRSLDGRGNGDGTTIPFLKDLKQSGSIEEDSDTVIFIVRPAYYKQQKSLGITLPTHVLGETQFIVAKGRNIGVRSFKTFVDFLKFNFCSYSDMDF